ncbi:MAG: hypothetical protein EPN99_16520 [Frankiales bacterium]|nr:MAG: hypothetical protein EPN99_16520 [Frankiales bacterium]
MTTRRILIAVAAVSVVLLVAIGSSRVSYSTADGEQPCPDRVWKAAATGLGDEASDPFYACTAQSQERVFAVAAGIMGLVLISGTLSRRD